MYIISNKQLKPQQEVNTLGKFLFKNIDSAYKQNKSSNMYDVWIAVVYEIPKHVIDLYDLDERYQNTNEMNINLNITTYSNKIRINIIEVSPDELTLGSKTYDLEKFSDYYYLRDNLMNYLYKRLEKRYEGFDFIF